LHYKQISVDYETHLFWININSIDMIAIKHQWKDFH